MARILDTLPAMNDSNLDVVKNIYNNKYVEAEKALSASVKNQLTSIMEAKKAEFLKSKNRA